MVTSCEKVSWFRMLSSFRRPRTPRPLRSLQFPGFLSRLFSMFRLIPFFFALSISLRVPVLATSCTGYYGGSLDVTSYFELDPVPVRLEEMSDVSRRADGQDRRCALYVRTADRTDGR